MANLALANVFETAKGKKNSLTQDITSALMRICLYPAETNYFINY
jgi:hypothetical protein